MDKLRVALSLHNRDIYFMHSLTTLESACRASSLPVHALILHDDTLGDLEQSVFRLVCGHYGGEAEFHNLQKIADAFPPLPMLERFSAAAFYRWLLPRIGGDELILYLDSDICVEADPPALARDWEKASLCVVKDYAANVAPGPLRGHYFNTGVMFMNCAVVNRRYPSLFEDAMAILAGESGFVFPDQTILNMIFSDDPDIRFLNARANFQISYKNRRGLPPEKLAGRIVHYTGPKPWKEDYPAAGLYRRHRRAVEALLATDPCLRVFAR